MDISHKSESDKPQSGPLTEPISIARFFKSARDRTKHIRVELSEYQGHALVNVRVWQTGSDGCDRPTVQGIALAIRKLPTLTTALLKAEDKARALGLLDESKDASS